ncbi:MAG TPA: YetF domain-containing protein [Acidimicrobiia bacterium]
MWFGSWESVLRILVHGTLGYVALVFLLRVSGKRALSKMNAFDFVITIALGSAFATLLISDRVPLVEGIVALGTLIILQWVVSSLYVRSAHFEAIVKGTPTVLYWRGRYLEDILRKVRITHEEVHSAMRDRNITRHKGAAAVLETDGTITVIEMPPGDDVHALTGVDRPVADPHGR